MPNSLFFKKIKQNELSKFNSFKIQTGGDQYGKTI